MYHHFQYFFLDPSKTASKSAIKNFSHEGDASCDENSEESKKQSQAVSGEDKSVMKEGSKVQNRRAAVLFAKAFRTSFSVCVKEIKISVFNPKQQGLNIFLIEA